MHVTTEQKILVQTTFAQVLPIADTAATLFYNRLFDLDPNVRAMFKGDMEEQGRKLMTMLKVAVASLDRLDTIVPAVEALGNRHVHYGVSAQDYDTVAVALLWTLEQGLGDAFTPEVRAAWTEVYTLLAQVMQSGARDLVAAA
jgi:hemoglobin-like flavoprotein